MFQHCNYECLSGDENHNDIEAGQCTNKGNEYVAA